MRNFISLALSELREKGLDKVFARVRAGFVRSGSLTG